MGDDVNISARSAGKINVQLILESLGGGGHFDSAGALVKDNNMRNALLLLKDAIDEYFEFKRSRKTVAVSGEAARVQTASKEQFLADKKSQSQARSEQRRLERMAKEQSELEAELDRVTEELYGEAATDYVRAASLEARKNEIEERLLEIYEELGV